MVKITAWKNSDGYITESEVIYKRRQKILDKYARLNEKKRVEGIFEQGGSWWLKTELKKAERTSAQIKQDKEAELFRQWRDNKKHQCKKCDGKGTYVWTDSGYGTDRDYTETCEDCCGTGLNHAAAGLIEDKPWLKREKNV